MSHAIQRESGFFIIEIFKPVTELDIAFLHLLGLACWQLAHDSPTERAV